MKKTTKGAFAAGTAAVLLMGGAGTLAYWSDGTTVPGASISSGELKIVPDATTPCSTAKWKFDAGETVASKDFINGDLIVPGDELTKNCKFTIKATGEHLRATMAVTNPALSGTLASSLDITGTTIKIDGNTLAAGEITEANNGAVIDVAFSVKFPGVASTNATQNLQAVLSDFTLTLTQVHN